MMSTSQLMPDCAPENTGTALQFAAGQAGILVGLELMIVVLVADDDAREVDGSRKRTVPMG